MSSDQEIQILKTENPVRFASKESNHVSFLTKTIDICKIRYNDQFKARFNEKQYFAPLTLRKEITLHITVIIFACPNIGTITLQIIGYHVINKPMLIPVHESIIERSYCVPDRIKIINIAIFILLCQETTTTRFLLRHIYLSNWPHIPPGRYL